MKTNDERARNQAKAQLESIREMVEALDEAEENDNYEAIDKARMKIEEDPLSVQVRSDWHSPGEKTEATEYMILLCTGGPSVRIVGDLGEYDEPETARIEYQDWFTPWEDMPLTSEEEKDVLIYAQSFYYGR
jgi:hypothetical protein